MTPNICLQDLIDELKKMPQKYTVPYGFGESISRLDRYKMIFQLAKNITIKDMLSHAINALENGDFNYCECYISDEADNDGDKIGITLINMWKSYIDINHEKRKIK